MIFDFASAPPIGTVLRLDDQEYELVEWQPATRNDGTQTMLLEWSSICPECEGSFPVTTGLVTYSINRRCSTCKNPARPVKGKRGRRVKISLQFP